MGDDTRSGETMTASVLFTDLVDSTAMRSRIGDEGADRIRRRHDDVAAAAVSANGGHVVKTLGDGLMATFEAAADAVSAAVATQQAIAQLGPEVGEPIEIRIGISIGDITFEDDDCFGSAVNEAARLCSAAQGSQILVADLVRAMARGRGGFTFESYGELELKGIPEPVATCSVDWEPLAAEPAAVPFPPALKPNTTMGYAGRPALRQQLQDLWQRSKIDGPQTVLLVGEPGIGKTRTAYEVARSAAADAGATILYGRCDEALRVPYQPFVEILDHQTAHAPDLPLGRLPGELRRLLGDLSERVPDLPDAVSSDARTEQHRLFEAVGSWVAALATHTPVVLVVDDLHWAAEPTLAMLMHVIRHSVDNADGVRLLVIGTYRDTDVDRAHPLSSVLADLRRIEGVHRIPVSPLDREEVIALIESAAGHELDDNARRVAIQAHSETDGNPFFVSEVLRHLIENGDVRFVDGRWEIPNPDSIDVPEGVRDVIGQRLSRLSDSANDALRAASVMGREFDLEIVAGLTEMVEDELLDALDDAMRARLVEETGPDRFRFTHALVQTALYEELSASRRRRMHRRITDLLAGRPRRDLTALAHHAVEAGPRGGDLSVAIGYVIDAAEMAQAARAISEAEHLFAKAIELLDEDDADKLDHRRLRVRCGIGEVLRDRGDGGFRETLLAVARDALIAGHDDLVVRSAAENTRGMGSIIGDVDRDRIEILRAALERTDDVATRCHLQSLLAIELTFDDSFRSERLRLADEAMAGLEGLDDPQTTASVLTFAATSSFTPERLSEMAALTERAIVAADICGDPGLRAASRVCRGWAHEAHGDLVSAGRMMNEALDIARAEGGPFTVWMALAQSAQFAAHRGDIDACGARNDEALTVGMSVGAPDATSWWAAIQAGIEYSITGTLSDPEVSRQFADQLPGAAAWRITNVAALALTDDIDGARAVLDDYDLWDVGRVPRDLFWTACMWALALGAEAIDDADLARSIHTAVTPFRDSWAHYGIYAIGPLTEVTARCAAISGDLDTAVTDARDALERCIGQSLTRIPIQRFNLARYLIRRDRTGDRAEAGDQLRTAIDEAEALGMSGWVDRSRRALDRITTEPS